MSRAAAWAAANSAARKAELDMSASGYNWPEKARDWRE
jgi:hypothetical protein